ncbi:DinB family protein [Roseiconus nitratireducens]|uniref:DinB family protein n=2 Tax=Roseiconus nitratireducens TaxID=2605748 RepID=A0A5M6D630_9BACT|nr:DinB family protein [Roseiconus nitratireducens]
MLAGVSQRQFARFAIAGNTVIESNHPCFILGHLSLYAPRVVSELGGDCSGIEPTEEFVRHFSKDARCVDDPDGNIYPSMEQVVETFRQGHAAALQTLQQTPDAVFQQPNPNERMQEKFPTIGAMHAFYLGGHFMLHIGQFSAWRRAMGLGAA